jgi:hypothetical protein
MIGRPEKILSVNKKAGIEAESNIKELRILFLIENLFFKLNAKPAINKIPIFIVLIKEKIVNSVVSKIKNLSERFIFCKIGK